MDAHVRLFDLRRRRSEYKREWARRRYADKTTPAWGLRVEAQRRARENRRERIPDRSNEYPSIKRRTRSMREYLDNLKRRPCLDCGGTFPVVAMDFDHVRGTKECAPSSLHLGWDRMLRELEKCEIVCSNCHRVRTHKRRLEWAFGRPVEVS